MRRWCFCRKKLSKKAHSTLTTTTIKMVSAALEEAIKDDNANVTPGAAFTDKKFTYELESTSLYSVDRIRRNKKRYQELPMYCRLLFTIKQLKQSKRKQLKLQSARFPSVVVRTIEAIGHDMVMVTAMT